MCKKMVEDNFKFKLSQNVQKEGGGQLQDLIMRRVWVWVMRVALQALSSSAKLFSGSIKLVIRESERGLLDGKENAC